MTEYTLRELSFIGEEEAARLATIASERGFDAINAPSVAAIATANAETLPEARQSTQDDVAIIVNKALTIALESITEALRTGYETQLYGYAAVRSAQSPSFAGEPDATLEDLAEVSGALVQGHMPGRIAQRLAEQVQYLLDGIIGQLVSGEIMPSGIRDAVQRMATEYSQGLSSIVTTAHATGSAAATREWGAYAEAVAEAG